jgi:hypothetical protein
MPRGFDGAVLAVVVLAGAAYFFGTEVQADTGASVAPSPLGSKPDGGAGKQLGGTLAPRIKPDGGAGERAIRGRWGSLNGGVGRALGAVLCWIGQGTEGCRGTTVGEVSVRSGQVVVRA